jgi:hypothetical protein
VLRSFSEEAAQLQKTDHYPDLNEKAKGKRKEKL